MPNNLWEPQQQLFGSRPSRRHDDSVDAARAPGIDRPGASMMLAGGQEVLNVSW
jgi:hypothetical protein